MSSVKWANIATNSLSWDESEKKLTVKTDAWLPSAPTYPYLTTAVDAGRSLAYMVEGAVNQVYFLTILSVAQDSVVATTTILTCVGTDTPGADKTGGILVILPLVVAVSGVHTYLDYLSEIDALVQDDALKLSTPEKEKALRSALLAFGKDSPLVVKVRVAGNGTSSLALTTLGSAYVHGSSAIKSVEYPAGSLPLTLLEYDEWEIYDSGTAQDGSNLVLRFLDAEPALTDYIAVEITTPLSLPSIGAANFPDTANNFTCITLLAAAFSAEMLAAYYSTSGDSSISADIVNYGDKSGRYSGVARALRGRYNLLVFGEENPTMSIRPAIKEVEVQGSAYDGQRYLFHGKH